MRVAGVFGREAGVWHANHKATSIHGRAHTGDGIFYGDAHGGVHAKRIGSGKIHVAVRFAAPNGHIFVPRAANRNQIGEPSSRQRTVDLVARRRRCNRDGQLPVTSPMEKVENAGQGLYAGSMEEPQILLGARTEQLVDTGGQFQHALQVLPEGNLGGTDVRLKSLFAERLTVTRQHLHSAVVVHGLGVHERAIEIEQKAGQRARWSALRRSHGVGRCGRWMARGLIVAALAACSNPSAAADGTPNDREDSAAPTQAPSIEVVLPERYVHWLPRLQQELQQMQSQYPAFAERWTRENAETAEHRRIVVPADDTAAAAFYAQAELSGDPATPRTFPALALAVVPLPRDDSLLAGLSTPPRTWLHSFRHEAAHLLSEDYPALRQAPFWFQEGVAELWCAGPPPPTLNGLEAWPYWRTIALRWGHADLATAPAEVRYSAFSMRTADSLQFDSSAAPWDSAVAKEWSLPHNAVFLEPFTGLRGRDADWDFVDQHFLLASRPGQQVDLDLPWPVEESSTTILEMQHGKAPSTPEAGLILSTVGQDPANSSHLRLRFGQNGGWAAYSEAAGEVSFEALSAAPLPRQPGLPHQVELRLHDHHLVIQAEGFRRRFNLDEINLQPPLQLRMYVRDGMLALRYR